MNSKDTETKSCPTKKTSIGGQALLEGIMMRGPIKTALAVRKPDGEMVIEVKPTEGSKRKGFLTWPVVRGVVGFVDSMMSGYASMMRSAELSGLDDLLEEEEREKAAKKKAKEDAKKRKKGIAVDEPVQEEAETEEAQKTEDCAPASEPEVSETAAEDCESEQAEAATEATEGEVKKSEKKESSGSMIGIMVVALILGLGLALLLFKVVPETVFELLTKLFPGITGEGYGYSLIRAAITGVLKIAILVAYMAAVALMKDIKRTFMYHGAEHKTIFCYEKGLELTVENVRKQSRFHPRCGTSFIILMLLVSILVNMFIPAQLVAANNVLNVIARTGLGILFLPFIMGIGYELIRFAGRRDNWLTKIISAPGVWLQHITTREPDDSMIECAIAALKEVIPQDDSDNW